MPTPQEVPSSPRDGIESANIGRTGELINTFKNVFKQGDVNCLCFVDRTSTIWTGGTDGQLCIYDIKNNFNNLDYRRVSSNGPLSDISSLTFTTMTCVKSFFSENDCTVWTGFNNGRVIIWDALTISKISEFQCHHAEVSKIVVFTNSKTKKKAVWTCSSDTTIKILDGETFKVLHTLVDHLCPVTCLQYLEGKDCVWSASDDCFIKIRDPSDGKVIKEIPSLSNTLHMVYTGKNIWTSCADYKLRIWDVDKARCIKEIKAHELTINGLVTTTKQVWSCGSDKVIHIFDIGTLKAVKKIKANSVHVLRMIELPNKRVFAFCSDSKVRVWECEGEPMVRSEITFSDLLQTPVESDENHLFSSPEPSPEKEAKLEIAIPEPTQNTNSTQPITTVPLPIFSDDSPPMTPRLRDLECLDFSKQVEIDQFDLLNSSVSINVVLCYNTS